MFSNDTDNLLQNYLDKHMPGYRATDPLDSISSLLAARDPGIFYFKTISINSNPSIFLSPRLCFLIIIKVKVNNW